MMAKTRVEQPEQANAQEIIRKLLQRAPSNEFSFYTDSRSEYEVLFDAAKRGLFPEMLSITRRGLRLNKRLVHAPLTLAQH
jgi:hypothetical protein